MFHGVQHSRGNYRQSYKNKRGLNPDSRTKSTIPTFISNRHLLEETIIKFDNINDEKKLLVLGDILNTAVKCLDVKIALEVLELIKNSNLLVNNAPNPRHSLIRGLRAISLCEHDKTIAYLAVDILYSAKLSNALSSIAKEALPGSAIKSYAHSKIIDLMREEV